MAGQRRFARLPIEGPGSRAFLADAPDERIRVRNLAFGGIGVELPRPLEPEGLYQFWLDLGAPFHDIVFATAQVRWVTKVGRLFHCGAQIVETNRTWLGPTKPRSNETPTQVNTTKIEATPPADAEENFVVRKFARPRLRTRAG